MSGLPKAVDDPGIEVAGPAEPDDPVTVAGVIAEAALTPLLLAANGDPAAAWNTWLALRAS
ncbi:MAG TPA: hypothetical protein PLV68_15170, partial [Ilumatobacteraceae bacterium]|nr:hypothetical protein [Ilumatobacteraceae bacterium]